MTCPLAEKGVLSVNSMREWLIIATSTLGSRRPLKRLGLRRAALLEAALCSLRVMAAISVSESVTSAKIEAACWDVSASKSSWRGVIINPAMSIAPGEIRRCSGPSAA